MKASDLLRSDHRRMETYLDCLLQMLKHLKAEQVIEIRQNFQEIQRLARTHFRQEEGIFYPALRSMGPDLLLQMDQQHEVIRETERYLDELLASFPEAPSDRDLSELYRLGIEFHDAVQCHIVDEEDHLLKWGDEILTEQQQEHLRTAMGEIANQLSA